MEGEPDWIGTTDQEFGGGFRPIFIPEGREKTLAEYSADESVDIAYRSQSFKKFLEWFGENF